MVLRIIGWMSVAAFSSGMVIRPASDGLDGLSCRSSWSSLTELAVGLTEFGCCAPAGAPDPVHSPDVNTCQASLRDATFFPMKPVVTLRSTTG
mgnify:CR=1 FL=1